MAAVTLPDVATQHPGWIAAAVLTGVVFLYLWIVNRGMTYVPPEATQLAQKSWTAAVIQAEYQRVQQAPTDVRPFLFHRTGRRYVVVGGSGLVGGWIVQHLLLRGEDPAAIRILDLATPTRPEVFEKKIKFVCIDVSDIDAVQKAFAEPWPEQVAAAPLTVFHTAAYINPADRQQHYMPLYDKINVRGVQNVVDIARARGASCFVATSSGSVGLYPVNYWIPPWKRTPDRYFQLSENGEPVRPNKEVDDFGSCYAYSKFCAESNVRAADDPAGGFRTGCIRPAHGIYGHGVESKASVTYDYAKRGGFPTWLGHIVANFVNAQNVSVGHLAYEAKLLADPTNPTIGGLAYAVTDPGGPIVYGNVYKLITQLAHPMHPTRFPDVPPVTILVTAYLSEAYDALRRRVLPFLPALNVDLRLIWPATLKMCTVHLVFDDRAAKEELGYDPPISILEGMCHQMVYFNDLVEERLQKKVQQGKGGEVVPNGPDVMPKPQSTM